MSNKQWFSPHNSQYRLGSLIEVSTTEVRINLTNTGIGRQKWIMGTDLLTDRVNGFIFIDCGSTTILARVLKVWLESGERLSVDNLDDSIPKNNPIGLAQLLVSVKVESGLNYGGVKEYPQLGSQVYAAHPKLVSYLAQGVHSSDEQFSLSIATMPNDPTTPINLIPEKLFARHCAILGSTGSGKSYTVATLIEKIIHANGKALLIDATGEYKHLPCKSFYVGEDLENTNEAQVTFPHWQFTDSDIRALLRPSLQIQAPKLSEAIRSLQILQHHQSKGEKLGINDLITEGNLVKRNKCKLGFEGAAQIISGIEGPHPWSFKDLSKQIKEECVWPSGRDESSNCWGGESEKDVGYCLSLISRIEAISSNRNLKWMIDCKNELTKIPDLLEKFAQNKLENQKSILRLDLSAVPFEANAREILVNAIGRRLLSLARKGKITRENPLLVFIDEAHQFLNKRLGEETDYFYLDAFGNIAKEGRKFGLNTIIATQRPRDIPEDVLSQIGTLIVHRLTNEVDQNIVKRAVGAIDYRSASFLPVLGQGEALLLGVDFPFPMTVQINKPEKEPTSNSTKFSEAWKSQ